jgi:hypothetical protein
MDKENRTMKTGLKVAVGAAVLGASLAGAGMAHAKEQLLGTAIYEIKPQRDVVSVGAKEGQFKAFRFEVRNSDVEVLDLKIVYGNGTSDDIRIRQTFKAGTSSRVIDLAGRQRAIKQIVVTYVARGPARIHFYGVEGAAPATWEKLGCKDVRFIIDRDTLRVGRQEGLFRAIRLRVKEAPVEFFDIRVTYSNGRQQDVRVRQIIRAGEQSGAIDLPGENRGIDKIEMIYRAIPTFKGTAEVCVDGLQR